MENGFLVAAGKGIQTPPLAWNSPDEPAPFGGHQRAGARLGKAVGDVDGGAFRPAGLEFGNDLQDRSDPPSGWK